MDRSVQSTNSEAAPIPPDPFFGANDAFPSIPSKNWKLIANSLRLSRREFQVSKAIVAGFSDAEIAVQLGISPNTVHAHLDRLYRKLNVHSRCQLVSAIFAAYVTLFDMRQAD